MIWINVSSIPISFSNSCFRCSQPFDTVLSPVASLFSSRGSSWELRRTQLQSSLRLAAKDLHRVPLLTARWMIWLAWGQLLPALRADTETRGGRKWSEPEGKLSHMVPQVYRWVIKEHFLQIALLSGRCPIYSQESFLSSPYGPNQSSESEPDSWPWLQGGKQKKPQLTNLIIYIILYVLLFEFCLWKDQLFFDLSKDYTHWFQISHMSGVTLCDVAP